MTNIVKWNEIERILPDLNLKLNERHIFKSSNDDT